MTGHGARQERSSRLDAVQRVTGMAERHAARSGLALQPDQAQRNYVLRGLADNLIKYGRPYCPCREVTGDPEKDRLSICPCRTHRDEVMQFGQCECGLFTRPSGNSGHNKECENGVHD